MPTWPAPITAITIFADDLTAAKTFYLEVFGLPVHWEDEVSCVFDFGNTLVNLLQSSEAPELIEPLVIGAADAGPRLQFTITVDDVDATAKLVTDRGATLVNGPVDRPWGVRTALFRDPTGQLWEIAADIPG